MAVTNGLSALNLGNKILDVLGRNTGTITAGTFYVQLHTNGTVADPSGTSNVSANTTRVQATFTTAASGGSMSLTSMASTWTMTASETISYISLWSASTSGTFYWSIPLTTARTVSSGDTLSLTSLTLAFTPIAA